MTTFQVGGVYTDSKMVCVWRGGGKRPRAHFVGLDEHLMNLEWENDYEVERDCIGNNTDNGVHPIHLDGDCEVAGWDGCGYWLRADRFVGYAPMAKTPKRKWYVRLAAWLLRQFVRGIKALWRVI